MQETEPTDEQMHAWKQKNRRISNASNGLADSPFMFVDMRPNNALTCRLRKIMIGRTHGSKFIQQELLRCLTTPTST